MTLKMLIIDHGAPLLYSVLDQLVLGTMLTL